MFFVPYENWKTLFFLKFCRYCEIFSTNILSFRETSVLKEVRILRYLHNNTNPNAKFQNKAIVYYTNTDLKDFRSFFTLFILWLFRTSLYK